MRCEVYVGEWATMPARGGLDAGAVQRDNEAAESLGKRTKRSTVPTENPRGLYKMYKPERLHISALVTLKERSTIS